MGSVTSLKVYGQPLDMVTSFHYLGLILTMADDYLPEVIGNFQKSRRSWSHLSRILVREGVDARTSGIFYLVIVQTVLLFDTETWVVTPHIGRLLGGVHRRVGRYITGNQLRKISDKSWYYPSLD